MVPCILWGRHSLFADIGFPSGACVYRDPAGDGPKEKWTAFARKLSDCLADILEFLYLRRHCEYYKQADLSKCHPKHIRVFGVLDLDRSVIHYGGQVHRKIHKEQLE